MLKRLVGLALAAVVAATLLIGGMAKNGATAHAATGDALGQITAAVPACGVGTGVAFDGTNLILDCWSSNQLWLVNPADGSLVDTLTITGASDLRAIAWDGGLGELWACNGSSQVVLIDVSAQTATPAFTSQGCTDGLAFDGTDDTLWTSGDAQSHIEHFQTDGTLIDSFSGLTTKLGGYGNSGIAVGGDKLYLANNGGSQIYQCVKDLSACTLMSTFPARIEDLECDNVTFAPKGAIWSIDAYDRTLNAWEIPAGTCNFGGGVAAPPTATPKSEVTPCIGGIVNSRCPKNPPVVNVTPTPEPTQTEAPAPSATAVPPTAVPPQPTATLPGGGAAGVITGPNTGSGPDGAQMHLGWLLLAVAALAGGAVTSAVAVRERRR